MAPPIDARPSCPECGCLMLMDANWDYADEQDAYHWECRRAYDRDSPCDGQATTPRSNVLSRAFRTEDMAIKKRRYGPPASNRLTRGRNAIKRAVPDLDEGNPLRAYLSSEENEIVDVALYLLDSLADSCDRADQTAPDHDREWQALAAAASIDDSDTEQLMLFTKQFLASSSRQGSTERVLCLDAYVKHHHGKSPGLRPLVRDYLANPLEAKWRTLLQAVGRVLTTEAYNVRPFSFEQFWKFWREDLPYRRALNRIKSLSFIDPDAGPSVLDGDTDTPAASSE